MDSHDESDPLGAEGNKATPASLEAVPMPDLPPFSGSGGSILILGRKFVLSHVKGEGEDWFAISKGTSLRRTVQRFPLTEEGWSQAFSSFARLEPKRAQSALTELRRAAPRRTGSGVLCFMEASLFLGGHGLPLQPGQTCDLIFDDVGLLIARGNANVKRTAYTDIRAMNISGRGELQRGGGFIGGGFGLEGAVTGIAIATLLNAATTKTSMETVLQIEAVDGEGFFHYGKTTPAGLRIQLSPVFGRLGREPELPAAAHASSGMADEIRKLADLRNEGLLTDEEFEIGKRRLLEAGSD